MKPPAMSSQTKILIGVLVLGAILAALYFLYFNTGSDATAVSTTGAPASSAEVTFLNLASQAEPISFDTSIFSDSRFTSLVDIHQAIVPEPEGRTDPFAPLGGVTSSTGQ